MQKLITITPTIINGQKVNAVDARTVHKALGSKKQFANWIKNKVTNNPFFMENQDYILLNQSVRQKGRGGHNRKDYALTIDTAKKVAMAEQTKTGDKIRDYFLECERIAQNKQMYAKFHQEKDLKPPSRSKIAADLQANHQIVTFFGLRGDQARLAANTMVYG